VYDMDISYLIGASLGLQFAEYCEVCPLADFAPGRMNVDAVLEYLLTPTDRPTGHSQGNRPVGSPPQYTNRANNARE